MITVYCEVDAPYEVRISDGALASLRGFEGRLAVFVDENVARLHDASLRDALGERAYETFVVPSGERHKTVATASRAWDWLASHRFERREPVVAIGGGVTGDLAGFVAATWLRGVPFVQVPTTLLAQVDASVGGKVAVDHPAGKNLIGAFHQPVEVLADTRFLTTLPLRERWAGLAEVVKTALLAGGELFEAVDAGLEQFAATGDGLDAVIAGCVAHKAAVVQRDPRERGERATLNLGHTIGHALELLGGYDVLLHGEAVAWGLRAELALVGLDDTTREGKLVRRLCAPRLSGVDVEAVLDAMRTDKKVSRGRVKFALIDGAGRARWGVEVPDAEVRAAVAALVDRT
jgi:3-dehydroquinate synthase